MNPRPTPPRGSGSADDGIALVVSLLFMLLLSALGAVMMTSSRLETLSTINYRMMSQARYGAESGVHKAANFILHSYALPPTNGDPLANFDITESPVLYQNQPVVLSARADVAPNYPAAQTRAAFAAHAHGTLPVGDGTVRYAATATLLTMQGVVPYGGTHATVVQTWQITARGWIDGARQAEVVVSAVIERQIVPVHAYALFALYAGCSALDLSSSILTDSYDSSNMTMVSGVPQTDAYGGNVGTNGNLKEAGAQTIIKGSLSTPRRGVGICSSGAVTAMSIKSGAQMTEGLIKLPQAVRWPLPDAPSPLPPTTEVTIQGGATCATVPLTSGACTITSPPSGGASVTLDPQGTVMALPNVQVTTGATLSLMAGSYNINSLRINGGGILRIVSGPVILNVAGVGNSSPIDFQAGATTNLTYDSSLFRILYAGDGDLNFVGGSTTSGLVYAPAANVHLAGNSHFYGSILGGFIGVEGGAQVHYDRRLSELRGLGPAMLSRFTWKQY